MFRQYAIPQYGYLTKDMKGKIAHVALTDHYRMSPLRRKKKKPRSVEVCTPDTRWSVTLTGL